MPKISIITICYNEPNLEETCKSIVNQTFQDFEWIVVDGGSNKETLDIFKKFKDRIDIFISEKDNGIYNAMNKGIRLAKGEYLAFMNAGDSYYTSDSLQLFIDNKLDKDIVYADAQMLGKHSYFTNYPDELDYRFWITNCLCHQATLVKRDLFEKYGLYNENLRVVSDYEKWIELIDINKCSYKHVKFIASIFRYGGISNAPNTPSRQERMSVIKKYYSQELVDKTNVEIFEKGYRFHERIFSIKNYPNHERKILTVLNIKIPIKKQKL